MEEEPSSNQPLILALSGKKEQVHEKSVLFSDKDDNEDSLSSTMAFIPVLDVVAI